MTSRSVSLTGATGFVGWHIGSALSAAGWHVQAIVRPGRAHLLPPGVDWVEAPLQAPHLTPAMEGSDLVVHCAAIIRARNYDTFAAVNVDGTRAVVEAANSVGARVLLISSQAAAGPAGAERPRREVDAPQPVNAYGRSKLAGEAVVRAHALKPWTILRPCAVYGPRDRGFLPLFQLSKRGYFFLPTRRRMMYTFIDVGDLARAVVLAAASDRAEGETMFIGHPHPNTTDDLLGAMAGIFGRSYRPHVLPSMVLRAAASAGDLAWRFGGQLAIDSGRLAELSAEGFVCAVDRARDLLGFTASTSLQEGLERTAVWYQNEGWL
jgi:nucleoside-diphosphate-sugar epimerase